MTGLERAREVECPQEPALVEAILADRWPAGADAGLRAHVAECEVCRETVLVSDILHEDWSRHDDRASGSRRQGALPGAAQVWWRAAVRSRVEVDMRANRPLTWARGLAGASAIGLGAAVAGAAWPAVREAGGRLLASVATLMPDASSLGLADVLAAVPFGWLMLAAGVVLAVALGPIAVYLALDDRS